MKNLILSAIFVCATGCASVTQDAVDGIAQLTTNTHNMGERYKSLLLAQPAPEGAAEKKVWDAFVAKESLLIDANTKLADKTLEWAKKAAGQEGTDK